MRVCIRVFGIVQGVGFRPTVKRHADVCRIEGSVSNKGPYVEIFAQGSEECVNHFIKRIQEQPPKRAVILKMDVESLESAIESDTEFEVKSGANAESDSKERFRIIESEKKRERFLFPQILRFVRNVRRNFMIREIEDIFIHLLTVPAVDRVLRF